MEEMVGLADAARLTGYSYEWMRVLLHSGRINGWIKIGNTHGIPRSEVDRLAHLRQTTPRCGPKPGFKRRRLLVA